MLRLHKEVFRRNRRRINSSVAGYDRAFRRYEGEYRRCVRSYAGVSLGLLHGAQPDVLVLCHEPTRGHMRGLPDYPIPDLAVCLEANLAAARLTNPDVVCHGVAVNTSQLAPDAVRTCLVEIEEQLNLPAVDPVRDGVGRIVDRL